ncbi:sel1 repeat family protein, partial [Pseudomonas sp. SIMBA_077]
EILAPIDIAPDVARQMFRCAAEQGHGSAAVDLGIDLKYESRYQEALEVLQMGVAAGKASAASRLENALLIQPPSNTMYYLDQQEDLERAERYEAI